MHSTEMNHPSLFRVPQMLQPEMKEERSTFLQLKSKSSGSGSSKMWTQKYLQAYFVINWTIEMEEYIQGLCSLKMVTQSCKSY